PGAAARPFLPGPPTSPRSRAIPAEEAASTAPARIAPSVAAMAWTSVRPMRPPAPATISRMSDMASLRLIRPAGIATWRCELGFALTQRGRGLVLRRAVAIERGSITRKFEHDGGPTHLALHPGAGPAAHEDAPAIFAERRHVGGHVGLVTLGLGDIDVGDPVAFAGRGRRLRRGPVRLHAIVALDDHEIANRMGKA